MTNIPYRLIFKIPAEITNDGYYNLFIIGGGCDKLVSAPRGGYISQGTYHYTAETSQVIQLFDDQGENRLVVSLDIVMPNPSGSIVSEAGNLGGLALQAVNWETPDLLDEHPNSLLEIWLN